MLGWGAIGGRPQDHGDHPSAASTGACLRSPSAASSSWRWRSPAGSSPRRQPLLAPPPSPSGTYNLQGLWALDRRTMATKSERRIFPRRQGVPQEAYGSRDRAFPPDLRPRAPPSPPLVLLPEESLLCTKAPAATRPAVCEVLVVDHVRAEGVYVVGRGLHPLHLLLHLPVAPLVLPPESLLWLWRPSRFEASRSSAGCSDAGIASPREGAGTGREGGREGGGGGAPAEPWSPGGLDAPAGGAGGARGRGRGAQRRARRRQGGAGGRAGGPGQAGGQGGPAGAGGGGVQRPAVRRGRGGTERARGAGAGELRLA